MDFDTETWDSSSTDLQSDQANKREEFSSKEGEQPIHTYIFGVFGFILQIFFSIGISASQDILEETLVPTPVVLISASIPFSLITSILPYFVLKLAQAVLLVPIVFLSITGVLLYALVEHVVVRVTGVIVVSTGVAIGEVTFVAMTALYSDSAMSSYAAGTGIGFVIGPLYYAGKQIPTKIEILDEILTPRAQFRSLVIAETFCVLLTHETCP